MFSWHDYHPRPLSFRRVMEGRPATAQGSWLFLMPTEIHDLIFDFVADNKKDLATLALVNSDCRQIARSYQFCSVTFTGSWRCEKGILALLQREAIERRQDRGDYGRTRKPSLGVCIRRVTAGEGGLNRWIRGKTPRPLAHTLEEQQEWWERRLPRVLEYHHQVYRPAVLSVLASLPSLDAARTPRNRKTGGLFLNEHLLNSLAGSTLRALELNVTMPAGRCPQVVDGVAWPLETLDLRLEWDVRMTQGPGMGLPALDASAYCDCILRLCCAALERLRIRLPAVPPGESLLECPPTLFHARFPRLRRLDMLGLASPHHMALRSLLTTSRCLSALSIDYSPSRVQDFLWNMAAIPALEVLILRYKARNSAPPPPPRPTDAAEEPDLREASAAAAAADRLERLTGDVLGRIVAFVSRHTTLKKVSLTFRDAYVPPPELARLGALAGPGLEELHVGAGRAEEDTVSWRRQRQQRQRRRRRPGWLVDHGGVRRALTARPGARAATGKLRRLSLTGDAYRCGGSGGDFCRHEGTVSERHRALMRREAVEYARALPGLERVYIGILVHEVVREEGMVGVGCEAVEDDGFDPVKGW